MNKNLLNYDIYPRMVQECTTTTLTVKPLGKHASFINVSYTIKVLPVRMAGKLMSKDSTSKYNVRPNDAGNLAFDCKFSYEQEHYIRIYMAEKLIAQLSVFALAEDLYNLRPYRGDTHMHTDHSDGIESPAIVASYYRKYGFDFMAITDHRKYEPSLIAIDAYSDVNIDIAMYPGEEVHIPGNDVHMINFGGEFSVNDLYRNDVAGHDKAVAALQDELDIPKQLNAFAYASTVWVYDRIREAKGLGIFPHPHWLADVNHVPDDFTRKLFTDNVMDAFEILGGQSIPENERQIALYNDIRSEGCIMPIVGASDSHGCMDKADETYFYNTQTIAFAPSLEKEQLIGSIKSGYSVAVDCYPNNDYRIHGSYRLTTYARFLLENYFPQHDDLCYEEGLQMKNYACGVLESKYKINALHGRCNALLEHLFAD